MRLHLLLALFAAGLLALGAPTSAEAQRARSSQTVKKPHDGVRLAPYVGVLAGGRRIVSGRRTGFTGAGDLLAGFGVGARLEKPLHDYFVLGGRLELSNDRVEAQRLRTIFLDLDLLPKARYLLNARGIDWEFYFTMPLGMSFGFYPVGMERQLGSGFNTGFLSGFQILLEKAGFFVDLGLRFRKSRYPIDDNLLGVRIRETVGIRTRQFNLNLGAVIYF